MKKPGEWIASLSAKLEVSQVDVEANEALDLVEVTEVDRLTGRPSSVRFFDRVEGARLRMALGAALDALERSSSDASRPRFEAQFADTTGERVWLVYDNCERAPAGGTRWKGLGAERSALERAARLNREEDHKAGLGAGA